MFLNILISKCRLMTVMGLISIFLLHSALSQEWESASLNQDPRDFTVEHFGMAVATAGNYVAVSVPGNSEGGLKRGYVQVLEKTTDGYQKLAKLRPTDGKHFQLGYQNFGYAINMTEDVIAVLGNYENEDRPGSYNVAVYVFEKSGSDWVDMTETGILRMPTAVSYYDAAIDEIAITDDFIAVGAPFAKDDYRSNVGEVYSYSRPINGWTNMEPTQIIKPGFGSESKFGSTLDIEGTTMVVGNDQISFLNDDPVMVYEHVAGSWQEVARFFKTEDKEFSFYRRVRINNGHIFLSSFIIPNSGNDDEIRLTIIKKGPNGWSSDNQRQIVEVWRSYFENIRELELEVSNNGLVCIINNERFVLFNKLNNNWANLTKSRILSETQYEPRFILDRSFDLSDNVFVIGVPIGQEAGFYNGNAIVYTKTNMDWSNTLSVEKITPDSYQTNSKDFFGYDLMVENKTLVASNYNNEGIGLNSVFVFEEGENGFEQVAELSIPNVNYKTNYGYRVSIHNDVIVATAPVFRNFRNLYQENVGGRAYVFQKPENGWEDMEPTAVLTPSDSEIDDGFGASIAQKNNSIVIGGTRQGRFGKVYVFNKTEGSDWSNSTENQIIEPVREYGHHQKFGYEVIFADNELIIAGFSFLSVYENNQGVWDGPIAELAGENLPKGLGNKLVYEDGVLVAGLRAHNFGQPAASNQIEASAAYVYVKPENGWVDKMLPTSILIPTDSIYSSTYETFDVSIENDRIGFLVGHYLDPSYLYVFDKPADGWEIEGVGYQQQDTTIITDRLGTSLALSNGSFFLGLPYSNEIAEEGGVIRVLTDPSRALRFNPDLTSSEKSITSYPNPAQGSIRIQSEINFQGSTLFIHDLMGNEYKKELLEIDSNVLEIDISELDAGIYTVTVSSGKDVISTKIIVSN